MTIDPRIPEKLTREVPELAAPEVVTEGLRDLEVEPVNFVPKDPLRP